MNIRMRCWIACLMACLAGVVSAQSTYDSGKQLWQQAKYKEAYQVLWPYREATPYGRTAQVDYMLGTSGCRLDQGMRVWGGNVLDWMLHRYPLPEPSRRIVQSQLSECRSEREILAVNAATVAAIEGMIGSTARASGKVFYFSGRDEAVNSYQARRVRDIPREEFDNRLFGRAQAAEVLQATQARVPTFDVRVFGRFVIAASTGDNVATLKKTALYLERYLGFLEREYAIAVPDTFITLYLVNSTGELSRLADQLHGLKVGNATFGYSFRDDRSLLAAVSGGFAPGTSMHELFHLAVRSQFGDIPQWLDEGLASLYEVSAFSGDQVKGIANWRGPVLKKLESRRPTLRQLIGRDWFAFEQPDLTRDLSSDDYMDMDRPGAAAMAASLATARYFTLFLQERGQLKAIYQGLRDLQPSGDTNQDVAATTISLIERELGMDIDSADREFLRWFHAFPDPRPAAGRVTNK